MKPGHDSSETKKPSWSEWLRHNVEYAKKQILKDGTLSGIFAIHGRDGQTYIVQADFSDSEEKRTIYDFVEMMCVAYDAIGLSHIAEAWVRTVAPRHQESPDELLQRAYAGPKPSQAEDRSEVIIITMIYRENEERHIIGEFYEIIREWSGKITGLRLMDPDIKPSSGDVLELLSATTPPAWKQAAAAAVVKQITERAT
jgi:hypothetical protein